MQKNHQEQSTLQNLQDAGCDCDMVECYCKLEKQPKQKQLIYKEQMRLLYKQRKSLLDQLHSDQRKLDCLDYLLFQLREHQQHSKG